MARAATEIREGADRLTAVLPLARFDASEGRGRLMGPWPHLVDAGKALAAGRGLSLLVRPAPGGWTAELIFDPVHGGPAVAIGTPASESPDAASAETAGRDLAAGLLRLAAPPGGSGAFDLHGTPFPLPRNAAASGGNPGGAVSRLARLVAAECPGGFTPEAFAAMAPGSRARLAIAVRDASRSGAEGLARPNRGKSEEKD